jgi:type I restriction enzyme S subunit
MLREFGFALPPIAEQKRIVDVVSSVDAYIDALQQQVDAARTARNAVLHELLAAGGDDWTETTLGDISTFVGTRATPESLNPVTPYIGLEHVDPKTPSITRWGDISSVSSSVTPFEPEDVLFGRLRPYLHKVAFADFAGVCTPEILVLRSSSNCDSRYLHLICSMDSTVKVCVEMSAGTRMPRTSTTDLASIQILLPPIAEQKRIVEIVSSMDDVIQAAERAVVEAKNLRSGLLSDLLSGEHDIPVSYDELLGAA